METDRPKYLFGTQVFIDVDDIDGINGIDGSCLETVPVEDSKKNLKIQQLPEELYGELWVIVGVNQTISSTDKSKSPEDTIPYQNPITYNIRPDNHNLEVDETFYVRPNSNVIIYGIPEELLKKIPSPKVSNENDGGDLFSC